MSSYGKYRFALLLFVLIAACSNSEKTGAKEGDNSPYAYDEIKSELSSRKDMIHFSKASGMLSNVLREQKLMFIATKGHVKNETGLRIEALLNEAAMFASQKRYDEAFKTLGDAHEAVVKSMKEMAPK